jgi:hypothetical protein
MARGEPGAPIRERIILNANNGGIVNRINEIHSVLNREIYFANQDVPPFYTEGSLGTPADIPLAGDVESDPASRAPRLPVDNLYIFAGGTYALYANLFGREGYDDGFIDPATGEPRPQVQKSVYLINEQCPNAYWNGDSTNYCPGFDADDVVSHEWSHAYTEYTHGLVYQYQSGALNEAYSDIFGETYDLVNGIEGPLGASLTEGDYYKDRGSRWVVGEDLSEAVAAVLLRDMWDPDDFPVPSPGSVITSENYYCSTGDNGGVHTNSGVANHAYAMLVDGRPNEKDDSTFNNVPIAKIGMTKAAHIYFWAETHYQTPTTNFAQHADALEQSCQDLMGAALNNVLGEPSGETITAADCEAVHAATLATEMRGTAEMSVAEKCNYVPVLQPEAETPTDFCGEGLSFAASTSEGWESGIPSTWSQSQNLSGDTEPEPFEWVVADAPAPHTGKAVFADDNGLGSCAAGDDRSASWSLDSPTVTVSDTATTLKFTHYMQSEAAYDGGNLKYSVDGGDFAVVPSAAFIFNGHSGAFGDGPLFPGDPGLGGNNTNPLAGEAAWTGSDQGEATGSWGTTIVNITALPDVASGSNVVFRWEFGQDGCGGNLGWYVDQVDVGYCKAGSSGGSNTLPVATLTPSTTSGTAPLAVTFAIGGADVDSGDRAVSYSLEYGDGMTVTDQALSASGTASTSHSYTTAGTYTAKLTVKDTKGGVSAAVTRTITVTSSGGGGGSSGGSGGAALGWLLLGPLGLAALLRRRKLH